MLRKKHFYFCLLLFIATNFSSIAQEQLADDLAKYKDLVYSEKLPEKILSSRSVVFVSVPLKANGERGNWKALAEKVHPVFRDNGVDVVAYYNLEDIFAGADVTRGFYEDLKKRRIDHVVLLEHRDGTYEITMTPFSADSPFIAQRQKAWKVQHSDLDQLLDQMYKSIASSGLEKTNYLIIEQPEYFNDTQISKGKRFPSFLSDLKIDKLAVPYFEKLAPAAGAGAPSPAMLQYNAEVEQKNETLTQIFAQYPFKFELVESNKTEETLRKAGFQYIIYYIHSTGDNIRQLINYPNQNKSETAGPHANTPVYKFYIKHVFTGDIYLGSSWDAAPTWQEALTNHIQNMRTDLKVNQ